MLLCPAIPVYRRQGCIYQAASSKTCCQGDPWRRGRGRQKRRFTGRRSSVRHTSDSLVSLTLLLACPASIRRHAPLNHSKAQQEVSCLHSNSQIIYFPQHHRKCRYKGQNNTNTVSYLAFLWVSCVVLLVLLALFSVMSNKGSFPKLNMFKFRLSHRFFKELLIVLTMNLVYMSGHITYSLVTAVLYLLNKACSEVRPQYCYALSPSCGGCHTLPPIIAPIFGYDFK